MHMEKERCRKVNKTSVFVWIALIVWLFMVACFFDYIEKESYIRGLSTNGTENNVKKVKLLYLKVYFQYRYAS